MFRCFQNLRLSISRPRRRRQNRIRPVACEAFEMRRVLSAVTALSAIEPLPLDADNESSVIVEVPEYAADALQNIDPLSVAAFDSATRAFAEANPVAAQDDTSPPQPKLFSFELSDEDGNPWDFDTLPPGALDAVFGNPPQTGDFRHPHHPPRPHPPLSSTTDRDESDDASDDTGDALEQPMSIESDGLPLPIAEQPQNNDADETAFVSAGGFVEIPRHTPTVASFGGLLQDELNSDIPAAPVKLHTPFFDLSNENERQAADDEDSATAAAMTFFNRQTDGGFVDAGLDDLRAAAGIAGASHTASMATSLEKGLGRFDPFDDGSHTTMLTAVELRKIAEADSGRDTDHSFGAGAAIAGIVLGTVGLRHGSLNRLTRTVRQFVTQLTSFFLSGR